MIRDSGRAWVVDPPSVCGGVCLGLFCGLFCCLGGFFGLFWCCFATVLREVLAGVVSGCFLGCLGCLAVFSRVVGYECVSIVGLGATPRGL